MQNRFQVKGKLKGARVRAPHLRPLSLRTAADKGRLRGMADKDLLPEADPFPFPFHRFQSLSQIQLSFIARDLSVRRLQDRFQRHGPAVVPLPEGQMQRRKGKIGLKPSALHLIIDDLIGLLHPSRKRQPPGLQHFLIMLRIGMKTLASRPERIFVDIDGLQRSASRYGQPEPSVSQEMSVCEFPRRGVFF